MSDKLFGWKLIVDGSLVAKWAGDLQSVDLPAIARRYGVLPKEDYSTVRRDGPVRWYCAGICRLEMTDNAGAHRDAACGASGGAKC